MNILILNENVSNVKESKAKILSNHCYAQNRGWVTLSMPHLVTLLICFVDRNKKVAKKGEKPVKVK